MRAAVVGSPIRHSLSPVMHRAAYHQAGLTGWTYDAVEVPAGGLAEFVSGLSDDWRGLSVTAPLKREAAQLASSTTEVVDVLGAANTLIRTPDGWAADNTDVPGAMAALAEAGVADVARVRILGGGATAASMAYALAKSGSSSIEIVVRDMSRADDAVAAAGNGGAVVDLKPLDAAVGSSVDLLISTVPVAAVEAHAEEWVAAAESVFDVIYDPWPTALASAARACGMAVVSGLDLLAHQAVLQLQQMANVDVDAELLRSAARAALANR